MTTEGYGDREKTGRLSQPRVLPCRKTQSFAACGNFFGARTSIKFSAPTAKTSCRAVGESRYHPLCRRRKISSFMYSKLAPPARLGRGERNYWMACIFRVLPWSEAQSYCSAQQVRWSVRAKRLFPTWLANR